MALTYPLQNPEDDDIVNEFVKAATKPAVKPRGRMVTPAGIGQLLEVNFDIGPPLQKALYKANETKELEPLTSLVRFAAPLAPAGALAPYTFAAKNIEQELREKLSVALVSGEAPLQMGLVLILLKNDVIQPFRFLRYNTPPHVTFFSREKTTSPSLEPVIEQLREPADDGVYTLRVAKPLSRPYSIQQTILPFFAYMMLNAYVQHARPPLSRPHVPLG